MPPLRTLYAQRTQIVEQSNSPQTFIHNRCIRVLEGPPFCDSLTVGRATSDRPSSTRTKFEKTDAKFDKMRDFRLGSRNTAFRGQTRQTPLRNRPNAPL